LSAVSVAAPIKRFANVGGWGDQALKYIRDNGINEVTDWPINRIDRRYYTEENRQKARLNRCTEWLDLRPKNFDQLASCLLRGYPVSVAYNWWGHLVTAIDLVYDRGEFCVLIWNSWGDRWGDGGLSVIRGNRKLPNEQLSVTVRHARNSEPIHVPTLAS